MLDLTFGPPPSRSNNGSLALVSCLSSGYKLASVLQCVGLFVTTSQICSGFVVLKSIV